MRAGPLADSDMAVRRLGEMAEITVVSPSYLAEHGTPSTRDDLDGHIVVGFVSSRTGQALPLEFTRDGPVVEVALPARVLVGGADASAAAALLGLGLVQAPRYRFVEDLACGTLVEVPAGFPPTSTLVSVLYPGSCQLSAVAASQSVRRRASRHGRPAPGGTQSPVQRKASIRTGNAGVTYPLG